MDSDENRQNTVDYLIKAASLLPTENYHQKLLKSFYLTKCKKLIHSVEKTKFSEEEMCRKCSTPWPDLNYSLSIAPIKTTKRKARKIQKQIENRSNRKNHLAKKLSKNVNNIVTIKCKLCDSRNKVILWKKSADAKKRELDENKTNPIQNKSIGSSVEQPQQQKKKKRKKDKNAGLLFSVVKDSNTSKQKIVKSQPQPSTVQMKLNVPKPFDKKPSGNKNKVKLQNKSKTKMKNIPQPAPKRSSLLQLANALKSKSNQSISSEDKLKQLLR